MKRALIISAVVTIGVFALNGLSYLADPGLFDIHIREKIQSLNEQQCAEIVDGCVRLYEKHRDSIPDDGISATRDILDDGAIITDDIPKPAVDVGYKQAVIRKDKVGFYAGAGGHSQIGPIVIICWIDPDTRRPKSLALDGGRFFNPETKSFDL
ncbi:hypothetical protein AYO49_00140 [Verrucomicrobiaceae bacterium SCGC AG-212-N21]|nr:hypothetical protein AYO49_00140 [Verrucomicrobiaceae bacterium SCGC AG-212-N21]